MSIEARRNRQLLEAYLWLALSLKRIAANQRWIFPPDALCDDRYPKAMVLFSGDKEIGLSPRGERILRSWQRRGLHIRWGMFRNAYAGLRINPHSQGYTTPANYERLQTAHANFMQVAQFEDGGQ